MAHPSDQSHRGYGDGRSSGSDRQPTSGEVKLWLELFGLAIWGIVFWLLVVIIIFLVIHG